MKAEKKTRSTEIGTPITLRLQADQLSVLDQWRTRQSDPPSRPEAIRRLLDAALNRETHFKKRSAA